MAATYEPIATTSISSNTASITFSSIPSTYTDLIIMANLRCTSSNYLTGLQFNSDNAMPPTGTNYSNTMLGGDGTSTTSWRETSHGFIGLNVNGATSAANTTTTYIIHINNYSNTTTYKTVLSRQGTATQEIYAAVGLWRNTAAINSFTLINDTTTGRNYYASGTVVTLYGIKAA